MDFDTYLQSEYTGVWVVGQMKYDNEDLSDPRLFLASIHTVTLDRKLEI